MYHEWKSSTKASWQGCVVLMGFDEWEMGNRLWEGDTQVKLKHKIPHRNKLHFLSEQKRLKVVSSDSGPTSQQTKLGKWFFFLFSFRSGTEVPFRKDWLYWAALQRVTYWVKLCVLLQGPLHKGYKKTTKTEKKRWTSLVKNKTWILMYLEGSATGKKTLISHKSW